MKHGVGGGKPADPPAVRDGRRRLEPPRRIGGRRVIEHRAVEPANRFLKLAIDGIRIAELGPDMAQVDPADVRDVLAAVSIRPRR